MSSPETRDELQRVLARSRAALDAGEFRTALELAAQAREGARALGDAHLEAEAVHREATCHFAQSDFSGARERLRLAVKQFAALDEANGLARALGLLASAEARLGNHELALDAAFRARDAALRVDDLLVRCAVAENVGIAHAESGAFREARESLEDGVRYATALQSAPLIFTATINLTFLAMHEALYARYVQGKAPDEAAIRHAAEACERILTSPYRQQALALSLAYAAAHLAATLALLGQSQRALAYAEEATREGRRFGVHLILCAAAVGRVRAHLDRGEFVAAEDAARDAVEQAGAMAGPYFSAVARRLLAEVHEAAGRYPDALRELHAFVRELQAEVERRMTHIARSQAWQRELEQREEAVRSLVTKTAQLEVERDSLAELSVTDALTGLKNRRFAEAFLAEHLRRAARDGTELAVAFVDIDRMKTINDSFSHRVGDAVLVRLARAMESCLRQTDVAARLAGDEFVVLMPGASAAVAEALKSRLQDSVRRQGWGAIAAGLGSVSVSVGVAQAHPGATLESLVEAADLQMYRDKRDKT